MLYSTRYGMAPSLLLASVLTLSGGFDASASDADPDPRSPEPARAYTTDLSPWGPHPETSLKQSWNEPRWMDLRFAEQEKISACSVGRRQAGQMMWEVAIAEYKIDIREIGGGLPRFEPVGERAKEFFREQITQGIEQTDIWPLPHRYGHEIALMYGRHLGYQRWEEDYRDLMAKGITSSDRKTEELKKTLREQFWPKCLEQIPTACFERVPAHPGRCLAHLIHPRQFPAFGETADIYMQRMVKPNGW